MVAYHKTFLPTNYPLLSSFFLAVRPTLGGGPVVLISRERSAPAVGSADFSWRFLWLTGTAKEYLFLQERFRV